MKGMFALAGESGSESLKTGAGGFGTSWTYVSDVDEHADGVLLALNASAQTVVELLSPTVTSIPGDANVAAGPTPMNSPEHVALAYR